MTILLIIKSSTLWKMSKYEVFTGPCFSISTLDAEILCKFPYSVWIGENTDHKNSVFLGTFHSVFYFHLAVSSPIWSSLLAITLLFGRRTIQVPIGTTDQSARLQRRIKIPVEHLWWSFITKIVKIIVTKITITGVS